MTPTPTVQVIIQNSSGWVLIVAASVQAAAALFILFLTWRLTTATQQYAADTNRMADSMAEERRLRLWEAERSALQRLHAATVNGLAGLEKDNPMDSAIAVEEAIGEYLSLGPQLSNAEMRDRIQTARALVLRINAGFPHLQRVRVYNGLMCVKNSLECLLRFEPLPARELPHYKRVIAWLGAPSSAQLDEYLEYDPTNADPTVIEAWPWIL